VDFHKVNIDRSFNFYLYITLYFFIMEGGSFLCVRTDIRFCFNIYSNLQSYYMYFYHDCRLQGSFARNQIRAGGTTLFTEKRGREENRYDVSNRSSKKYCMNATTTTLVFPPLGISDRAVPATRHQPRDRSHLSASQGRARMHNAHSSLI
jgi:hypothetical protein